MIEKNTLIQIDDIAPFVGSFIQETGNTLCMALCWFTHPEIFEELLAAARRGVVVRLLLNHDQINFRPGGLPFERLTAAGGQMRVYAGVGLLHHKWALADGARLLLGSFNWTCSQHREAVVVLKENAVIADFYAQFEAIWAEGRTLDGTAKPQRQVVFEDLFQPRMISPQVLRRSIIGGARAWVVRCTQADQWAQFVRRQQYFLPLKMEPPEGLETLKWPDFLKKMTNAGFRPATSRRVYRAVVRVQINDVMIALGAENQWLGIGLVGSEARSNADGLYRYVPWLVAPDTDQAILPATKSGGPPIQPMKGSVLALIHQLENYPTTRHLSLITPH
jgi:hypothetical protein